MASSPFPGALAVEAANNITASATIHDSLPRPLSASTGSSLGNSTFSAVDVDSGYDYIDYSDPRQWQQYPVNTLLHYYNKPEVGSVSGVSFEASGSDNPLAEANPNTVNETYLGLHANASLYDTNPPQSAAGMPSDTGTYAGATVFAQSTGMPWTAPAAFDQYLGTRLAPTAVASAVDSILISSSMTIDDPIWETEGIFPGTDLSSRYNMAFQNHDDFQIENGFLVNAGHDNGMTIVDAGPGNGMTGPSQHQENKPKIALEGRRKALQPSSKRPRQVPHQSPKPVSFPTTNNMHTIQNPQSSRFRQV